ncbi:phage holin family protein [Tsukamurella sp. 8F]|uniref:phage holin family protein n=1 Tax=unclassified Tsukamurella TaxID=2633480 RepID=UPI0023B9A664|nr:MULTISPECIES: phage holin family protein [unclassified Tsukamurella]MDF0529602.1 phage holin family protein [Tsukamurella sp. 8J]MDF0585710.1 phage holin family protein [Tsukamurella sp. 8F]
MSLDSTSTTGTPRTLSAIPLSDPSVTATGEPSIGALVRDASAQVSSLVRAEVELAKAETVSEVKKAVTGSVFFVIAGVVLLYSSFFLFFFLGELLDVWLPRWAAFLIVFALMVVVAVVAGLLGYLKVRKIRGPKKTIASVKEVPSVLPTGKRD